MWKKLSVLLALSFWLPCSPSLWSYSRDAQTDPLSLRQTTLSSALREALTDSLRYQSELETRLDGLLERLSESESLLEGQRAEYYALSNYLTNTMNSFRSLSAELWNSTVLLTAERERRRTLERILAAGSLLFVAMVVGKITVFVLSARGVRIPKILKIIV